jgi:1,4-dihydroxy-2-naphthoate octaprenyltransferase
MNASVRSLAILARLRLLPFVLVLVLLGFGWAHWDRALRLHGGADLVLVLLAWTALHTGTMWLNACLDKDDGEVLFGETTSIPHGLERWGYLALLVCVVLGWRPVGWIICCCVLLAILYSHPWSALKGHAVGGPMINLVGYGLLSPYAGWVIVGVPANLRSSLVLGCASMVVLGCYFAAQAFQEAEDRARGYSTLVVHFGAVGAIRAARVSVGLGILGGLCLALWGWLPRSCLLIAPLALVLDGFFAKWEAEPSAGSEAWARSLSWRLLALAILGVSVSGAEYVLQSYRGVPVAGLGTASGHPVDRPLLAPREMWRWESENGITK